MDIINELYSDVVDGVEYSVYEALLKKALDNDFNSLLFRDKEEFIIISDDNYSLLLEVTGEVSIFDTEDGTKISGDERFKNKELMDLIKSGELDKSTKYSLEDNNWFAFTFFKRNKMNGRLESIDDMIFEEEDKVEDIYDIVEYSKKIFDFFLEKHNK